MDNENYSAKNDTKPLPGHAKEALELPEARDETTRQIHEMSDFKVSDYLGLPLLTKDVGKTTEKPSRAESPRSWGISDSSPFAAFDSRDRILFIGAAVMILGPLFLGAFHH